MKIYLKGFNLIKKKFKFSILILVLITIIGAILEGISIALLLPIMELLINPDKILNNDFINLSKYIDEEISRDKIIYYFLFLFFVIFLVKNIFVILINYSQSKILLKINFYLSNSIFEKLLNENFLNVIEKKSSSIIRTMISQTSTFSINFINSKFWVFNLLIISSYFSLCIFKPEFPKLKFITGEILMDFANEA